MIIYLAGAENTSAWESASSGAVKDAFYSFYYGGTKAFTHRLYAIRAASRSLIVDSGAHTFFSAAEEITSASTVTKKSKLRRTPQQYWEEYLAWLVEHQNALSYFVELDVGEIVGQETVLGWRQQIVDAGLASKCIIVHHPANETCDEFIEQARAWPSRYVACEGFRMGSRLVNYMRVLRACYAMNVRVHGFAMVKREVMMAYPFYSVDSSSWTAAHRFGSAFYFDRVRMTMRAVRFRAGLEKGIERGIAALGVAAQVPKKYSAPDVQRVLALSAAEFEKMAEAYTVLWCGRGVDWDAGLHNEVRV